MRVYYSKKKLLRAFLLGCLMTVISIFVFFNIYQSFGLTSSYFGQLVAIFSGAVSIIGILLFGGMTSVFMSRFFDAQPKLIITTKGLEDKRLNTGLIEWSEILQISLLENKQTKWINLTLASPDKYFKNLTAFQRVLRKANGQRGKNNLRIRFEDLDAPIEDVVKIIEKNYQSSQKELALAP